VKVFYREAGPTYAPVILLLHGFPTTSCVADMKHTGVVLLPLVERIEPNPLVLVWSKHEESPALSALINLARTQINWLKRKILPAKWSRYSNA